MKTHCSSLEKSILISHVFSELQKEQQEKLNMTQIQSSDLVIKNTAEAVMVPLKDGICSLNIVYKTLIDAAVDPISGKCFNYNTIRQQIERAEQSLQRLEQQASSGLRSLDGSLEKLMQDEGKIKQDKNATEQTLNDLKTNQKSYEKLLTESERALKLAQGNLHSARQTLQNLEDRRHHAQTVRDVGLGVLVIPVLGWIAGSIMVAVGAAELDQASKAIKDAEGEEHRSKNQVEKYKAKVSEYEYKISNTKWNIRHQNDKLEQIQKDIQKVIKLKGNVSDFQKKVRYAVRILSVLSGRASVLECQTRKFVLQQPVMRVMDEVMKAAEQISGNQLLHNKEILSLVCQMRENHQKLAAICAADTSNEYA